jgi:tetratricopeptide (TPR) repeat protein
MKHISLRIDEKDYEFIRTLSRKRKIPESNIFREILHDYVLRSTGQTSLSELELIVQKMANEFRDLENRVARIEGVALTRGRDAIFPLEGVLASKGSPKPDLDREGEAQESSEVRLSQGNSHDGSSKLREVNALPGQAIGEIMRQFASQKGAKLEEDFLRHCVSAGESAFKIHDCEQAAKYYRIALELSEEREIRSEISERIGDAEYLMGENDLALKYWNDAALLFQRNGESFGKTAAARVYRKIGVLYLNSVFDREKGLAALKEAEKLLSQANQSSIDLQELAAVYESIARLYWRMGENLSEAEKLCEKALAMAEKLSVPEIQANAHQTLAFLLPITRKEEIVEHFQKSLKISIENGCIEETCRAYNNLGYLYIAIGGDMKKSVQFYLEGLRFERRTNHSILYSYTKLALSLYAYIPMGEWSKAEESVNEFLPELSAQHPHRFASAFQILGQVALCRGEYKNAQEYFDIYLPIATKAKEIQAIIPCYISLGQLHFEKLEYSRAEEYLRTALELCRKLGLRFDNCMRYTNCLEILSRVCLEQGKREEAEVLVSELSSLVKSINEDWAYGYYYRALGCLSFHEGRLHEAINSFEKSAEKWRRLGWPFEQGRDRFDLALSLLMNGETERAKIELDWCVEVFDSLGAKAYTERAASKRLALPQSTASNLSDAREKVL